MINIIFPKKSPMLNGFQFDATLEDTIEATVDLARYPIESGAKVHDHRILNPIRYFIVGSVGSQSLRPLIDPRDINLEDLAGIAIGAATNLFRDNPLIAMAGGLGIGFLAGSEQTRPSSALEFLLQLMYQGDPFTVDAVDRQLKNMVITKISRTRDPSNEEGLIAILELQELLTLDRIKEMQSERPTPDQLIDGDPSQLSCSREYHRGQQIGKEPSVATATAVRESVIIPTTLPPLQ